MKLPRPIWIARLNLLVSVILSILTLLELEKLGYGSGELLGHYALPRLIMLAFFATFGLVCLILLALTWRLRMADTLLRILQKLPRAKALNIVALVLGALVLGWLAFRYDNGKFSTPVIRLWLIWFTAIFGAFFIQRLKPMPYALALASALLIAGAWFQILTFLPGLTDHPLSLGWSEGSRFYYGSLFFARQIYGEVLPIPVLHPARYLMQSLPFAFPSLPILAHRIWQVILWVVCNAAAAWLLVRRLRLNSRWLAWMAVCFAFLFFFQGPVYYHLILCTLPVLAWFDSRRPWRTLVVVLLSSLWAGLCRVNWYVVPGVLAATLYLLEQPQPRFSWRYWVWPALHAILGTAAALLFSTFYKSISGNSPEVFGSAFDSPLLWNRLFPNTTYPLGMLLGTAIAVLPFLLIILWSFLANRRAWHPLRLLGLGAILFVFLAGGEVVSLKIGGGSNLHNLDAFLVFQVVIGLYLIFNRFVPDAHPIPAVKLQPAWWLAGLTIVIPFFQMIGGGQPLHLPDRTKVSDDLSQLQVMLNQADGPVLFLTERHLLSFKTVTAADFEPEYEKVFLMEMVMSGNQTYLDHFYSDLQQHRFALIVSEPMNMNMQDERFAFAEENNYWVQRVEQPVSQYYRVLDEFNDSGFHVWVPVE
ncbi:MAG TPA: hypothetical protein PLT26_00480 [Anaerolineaceae bacterium]|nr:hypothetical protein [Anaerolineaceae bacterium]HQH84449.1 hypothetical protein [Anaerolineaceae bacterium]